MQIQGRMTSQTYLEAIFITISTQKAKIQAKNNKLGRLQAVKNYIRIFVFLDLTSCAIKNIEELERCFGFPTLEIFSFLT